MSNRTKNLALAAIVAVLLAALVWQVIPSGEPPSGRTDTGAGGSPIPEPGRAGEQPGRGGEQPVPDSGDTRLYAVSVAELPGLPPDAPAGTRLEIWVAWDPPLTERPRIQKLLPEVTLDEIIPPVTPDGPAAAMLRVRTSRLGDLLYGDRYGSLSATVLPRG